MYKYKYVDNIVPRVDNPKLFLGRGVHAGIAAYYEGKDPLKAFDDWLEGAASKIPDDARPADVESIIEPVRLGRKLVGAYVDFARQNDDFEVVAIEQDFRTPVWSMNPDTCELEVVPDVFHRGRLDGVVRDKNGRLWVLEHKTCAQFTNPILLQKSEQTGYYVLACKQLFDEPVVGTIYNLIRKVDPAKARTDMIRRELVPCNDYEVGSYINRLYNAYNRIVTDDIMDPSSGQHCTWMCPYRVLCTGEDDGSDVASVVDELFMARTPYEDADEEEVA